MQKIVTFIVIFTCIVMIAILSSNTLEHILDAQEKDAFMKECYQYKHRYECNYMWKMAN